MKDSASSYRFGHSGRFAVIKWEDIGTCGKGAAMIRDNRPMALRARRFLREVAMYTPVIKMVLLLVALWLLFSGFLYLAESGTEGTTITSMPEALYWGIAAFSTAGIADTPVSGAAKLVGGIWIVLGSILFFGTIVASVTAYFMRPLQRPAKQIVDTIEYNLEQLDDLTLEELELLRETVDTLIGHMERLKSIQPKR
jgi:voltage-gated potassium channel